MNTPTDHEDPRRARSRARVLEAAVDLLRAEGMPGLTIEAVACRSGVAKTTIYRQFADREELHVAALQSVASTIPMPCTDDLVADVTSFCAELNRILHTEFGGLMATAIDGGERSPSLAAIVAGVGVQRRKVLADRLRTGQRAGALPEDADLDLLGSQLVGPLFFRRFVSRQPTGHAFVARHVQSVLGEPRG